MMGATHVTTGVTTAAGVAAGLAVAGVPPALCLASIPVGAYATLLPDLDHPDSRATWMLPPISHLASWALRGAPYDLALPLVGWGRAGRLLPWRVTHRGATHTPEAAVVFGLVLGLPFCLLSLRLGAVLALQIMAGCLTHRWGDMRTTGGVAHRTLGRTVDTGSAGEYRLRAWVYRPTALLTLVTAAVFILHLH